MTVGCFVVNHLVTLQSDAVAVVSPVPLESVSIYWSDDAVEAFPSTHIKVASP